MDSQKLLRLDKEQTLQHGVQQEQQQMDLTDNVYADAMKDMVMSQGELMQSTWNGKDSLEMIAVKDALTVVKNAMFTEIPKEDSSFQNSLNQMESHYNQLIHASNTYLDKRKNAWTSSGKLRFQMVQIINRRAKADLEQLKNVAIDIHQNAEGQGIIWGNILGEIRAHSLSANREELQTAGGGTSEILIIPVNRTNLYFKKEEKFMPRETQIVLKYQAQPEGRTEKEAAAVKFILDGLTHVTVEHAIDEIAIGLTSAADHVESFVTQILSGNQRYHKKFSDLGFFEDESVHAIMIQIFKDYAKASVKEDVAKGLAKIQIGQNISDRNVATSRMASLLHIDNIVARSTKVTLSLKGEEDMNGMVMLEAQGKSIHGETERYSPQVLKQLTNLAIFDMVCGQVDRNFGNYLCQMGGENKDVIQSITAIDNDMSFGLLSYEKISSGGKIGEISPLVDSVGQFTYPFLSKSFIERLEKLTPEHVNFILADLLNEEELNALNDRLKGVIDEIQKHVADGSCVLLEDEQWDEKVLTGYRNCQSRELETSSYISKVLLR